MINGHGVHNTGRRVGGGVVIPPPTFHVNALPTGPATPSGGWSVIFADAFAPSSLSNLWFPGRDPSITLGNDEAPDNSNELQAYNSSQVMIGANGGLILRQAWSPGRLGGTKNYVSGTVRTWPVGGRTGFKWLPGSGSTLCFESVITMPVNPPGGGGNDLGWWAVTQPPPYKDEIDFFEQFGSDPNLPLGYAWIYNTGTGASVGGTSTANFGPGYDGQFHRWSTVIFPDTTSKLYLDGVLQTWYGTSGTLTAPPSFDPTPMGISISWALRLSAPGFVSGFRDVNVASVAVYQDTPHAGTNITGGGVATGTTVS